jgi:hypothetical protein
MSSPAKPRPGLSSRGAPRSSASIPPRPIFRRAGDRPTSRFLCYTLLSQGVLIAEHVTGLAPLSGRCTEIMFLGLNIAGSDGAPARATARAID